MLQAAPLPESGLTFEAKHCQYDWITQAVSFNHPNPCQTILKLVKIKQNAQRRSLIPKEVLRNSFVAIAFWNNSYSSAHQVKYLLYRRG